MKILTTQEMRNAEAAANAAGLPYQTMMERAGSAVAQEIVSILPVQQRRVLVLVGPGNNGGDGLVAARYLHDARAVVTVVLALARAADDDNVRQARERGVSLLVFGETAGAADLQRLAAEADVVIDALLGTGARLPVGGVLKDILDVVRAGLAARADHAPLVVAVDVPSGLDADTGRIDGVALAADVTVTFACPKRGHFLFPGAGYIGQLSVVDIGIAAEAVRDVKLDLADVAGVAPLLPRRPLDAHKGTFGRLLVVAGCANYTGAAYLAATAAYRAGAGLVTLALPAAIHQIVASKTHETTFLPLAEGEAGYLGEAALPALRAALPSYDTLLIGCGLGAQAQTRALVRRLLAEGQALDGKRIVIDADGLNALAESSQWPTELPPNCVLTPHPGEMARLSRLSAEAVASDRVGLAMAKAAAWRQVVLLKGAFTIIAAPDGRAAVIPFATPALATAGTGDVLAGVIAGLLAQGCAPYDAALCGAYLHGMAAEAIAAEQGEAGMLASDLLPALPHALKALRHPPAEDEKEE